MKRIDYKNKVVVITGASSGIGFALSRELILKHGARVYAVARGEERLQKAREELGENYLPYKMDAGKKESWVEIKNYLAKKEGKIDILINCAGVLPEFKSYESVEENELEGALAINLYAQLYSTKELLPIINQGGAIINISSASALCPFGGIATYALTKSASSAFTESLACELKGISASAVLPGFVKTDIMKNQELKGRESKIIAFFSARAEVCARKILRRARRRRRKIIVGKDAHLMSFLYKLAPNCAPRIITRFLKKSGLMLFSKI